MLLFFQFVWLTNYNDIKVDSEKTKSRSNSAPGSPTTSLRKRCYLCVSDGNARKFTNSCSKCEQIVCNQHLVKLCTECIWKKFIFNKKLLKNLIYFIEKQKNIHTLFGNKYLPCFWYIILCIPSFSKTLMSIPLFEEKP